MFTRSELLVLDMGFTVIFHINNANISYLMFRPPRPPSKTNTPQSILPFPSGRQIHVAVSRFSSEENAKSLSKHPRRAEVLSSHSQENYQTAVATSSHSIQIKQNQQANSNQTVAVHPSGFKIRYLSSRGRRSKQNIEPNENKINQYIMKVQVKDPNSKQDLTALLPTDYQTHAMEKNPQESQFFKARCKTGVIKLSEPARSQTCMIISESIFGQSMNSDNFVYQLKYLSNSLLMGQQGATIAIKMQTNLNVAPIRDLIESNNIPIDYMIWNSERCIAGHNVLSLQKLNQVPSFVIFHDTNEYSIDLFATGNPDSRYFYCQGSYSQICDTVAHLELRDGPSNDGLHIAYNKNSEIMNKTKECLTSQHIINRISIIKPTRQGSISSSGSTKSLKQFDEQYRNKMIQLAKLLISQSQQNQENGKNNRQNSNHARIKLSEQVCGLIETSVSCTTAYQFVSEIVRNNGFNCKQIAEFREKCKSFSTLIKA